MAKSSPDLLRFTSRDKDLATANSRQALAKPRPNHNYKLQENSDASHFAHFALPVLQSYQPPAVDSAGTQTSLIIK